MIVIIYRLMVFMLKIMFIMEINLKVLECNNVST